MNTATKVMFEKNIACQRTKRALALLKLNSDRAPECMTLLRLFVDPEACVVLKSANPQQWHECLRQGEALQIWPVNQFKPEVYEAFAAARARTRKNEASKEDRRSSAASGAGHPVRETSRAQGSRQEALNAA